MLKWWGATVEARKIAAVTPSSRCFHTIQVPREIFIHRVSIRERFLGAFLLWFSPRATSIVVVASVSRKVLISTERKQIKVILKHVKLPYFCLNTFSLQIRADSGSSTIFETRKVLSIKIHMDKETGKILNLVLVCAEDGTKQKVDVLVVFTGEDVCPGLKKGGRLNMIRTSLK
ncbi:Ribosomal protein L25/Gln-tRNA synthetase [Forsythia ovata]|uniref:Ribosomal protein L25/Gln-tRNA synthetase n=1 Tax=Forsythia ovata TaxID=205694 RepID=A0ABD1XCK7_9LAMI